MQNLNLPMQTHRATKSQMRLHRQAKILKSRLDAEYALENNYGSDFEEILPDAKTLCKATVFAYGQTGAGKTFTMMGGKGQVCGYYGGFFCGCVALVCRCVGLFCRCIDLFCRYFQALLRICGALLRTE